MSRLAEGDSWDGVYDKLLQLKEVLEPDKNDDSLVVLFADGYDVLFNGAAEEILERFTKFNASIVFSAEKACFPRFYCSRYMQITILKKYFHSHSGKYSFGNAEGNWCISTDIGILQEYYCHTLLNCRYYL